MKARSLCGTLMVLVTLFCGCSVPRTAHQLPVPSAGVPLKDQPVATPTDAISTLNIVADEPFISDDSYASEPSLLLGKVAEIDAVGGSCALTPTQVKTLWVGRLVGLKISAASKPQLRASLLANRATAAGVTLLSYLSGSFTDSSLYSLIVNDQDVQRVDDADPSYAAGRQAFVAANAAIMNAANVCWLLQVDGITFKTITKRKYTVADAKAGGGAYGVKANGSYYASNEDYSLDYRFGLSLTVLKRPPTQSRALTTPVLVPFERNLFSAGITAIRERK
jgi:hypothetical protein